MSIANFCFHIFYSTFFLLSEQKFSSCDNFFMMATKNLFVNEFGEISTELLLNIAEILVLRLPEGTGKKSQSVNNLHNKFIFLQPTPQSE